jgi:polyhydroxyalkanoate synthesis regulator protein
MLPVNFLRQLIGLYGNSMQGMVPQYLEAAMEAFQRNQTVMRDAFGTNVLTDLAKKNMAMFGDASRVFTGKGKAEADKKLRDQEVEKLRAELAELQAKVDRLGR